MIFSGMSTKMLGFFRCLSDAFHMPNTHQIAATHFRDWLLHGF